MTIELYLDGKLERFNMPDWQMLSQAKPSPKPIPEPWENPSWNDDPKKS